MCPVVRPARAVDVDSSGGKRQIVGLLEFAPAVSFCGGGLRSFSCFWASFAFFFRRIGANKKIHPGSLRGLRETEARSEGLGNSFFAIGERSFCRERERNSEVVQRGEGVWIYPALHGGGCVRAFLRHPGERLPHAQ